MKTLTMKHLAVIVTVAALLTIAGCKSEEQKRMEAAQEFFGNDDNFLTWSEEEREANLAELEADRVSMEAEIAEMEKAREEDAAFQADFQDKLIEQMNAATDRANGTSDE